MATETADIAVSPRDGIFFKDGRDWYASESGRGHAVPWPFPSSLRGAVRTVWGRQAEVRAGEPFGPAQWEANTRDVCLGPSIALRRLISEDWSPRHRMWPTPRDCWFGAPGTPVKRLVPRRSRVRTLGSGAEAVDGLWRPDMPHGKQSSLPSFLNDDEFLAWLGNGTLKAPSEAEVATRSLLSRVDVRIAMNPATGAAAEGALFVSEVLETLQPAFSGTHEWGIGMQVTIPSATGLEGVFTLGSDRRLGGAQRVEGGLFAFPRLSIPRASNGLRLVVVTPAEFSGGWLVDGFSLRNGQFVGHLPGIDAELALRAALVPRPIYVSGWDMANRKPKASRALVAAGATYFLQKASGGMFGAQEIESLWLAALGQAQAEGFGRVVAGPWEIENE